MHFIKKLSTFRKYLPKIPIKTMAEKHYMFLVDDESIQNEMLKDYLSERFAHQIKTFSTGESAITELHHAPEVVVLDYHLSAQNSKAQNGVEILKKIKEISPTTQVIMLSGQDKIEVAIDTMKYGAYDYVVKGESAFSRIENIINNLGELNKVKELNKGYKRAIVLLSVVLGIIILLTLYLYFFRRVF